MDKRLFEIDSGASTPKYRQIIDGVVTAIEQKELSRGDTLPSVNKMCRDFSLARETVIKAYTELKSQGIIESVPGKGYYVASEYTRHCIKVFALFDSLSTYKQDLYDTLKDELGDEAILDIYFHHFNADVFERLLLDSIGKFGVYLVMPFAHKRLPHIFEKLDPVKLTSGDYSSLVIFDREQQYAGPYSYIGQNFDTAVYDCLVSGRELIQKYHRFVMVTPRHIQHPAETFPVFERFCQDFGIEHVIIPNWKKEPISEGTAYFVVDDHDVIYVIEQSKAKNFTLGQNIGLLSYNDTVVKRVLCDGITVLSTDFIALGTRAAQYVRNPLKTHEIIPTRLIVRNSL